MEIIDFKTVRDALDEIVASKPDTYSYRNSEGCWYAGPDGDPDCIIGHVIHKFDPDSFAQLREFEMNENQSVMVADITLEVGLFLPFDESTLLYLCEVQEYQDEGVTWLQSLRLADLDLSKK